VSPVVKREPARLMDGVVAVTPLLKVVLPLNVTIPVFKKFAALLIWFPVTVSVLLKLML